MSTGCIEMSIFSFHFSHSLLLCNVKVIHAVTDSLQKKEWRDEKFSLGKKSYQRKVKNIYVKTELLADLMQSSCPTKPTVSGIS